MTANARKKTILFWKT